MDRGVMLKLPQEYRNKTLVVLFFLKTPSRVYDIRKYLHDVHEIDFDFQILLATGGVNMHLTDRLVRGEGEDETNPLFLFKKNFSNNPPADIYKFVATDQGISDQVQASLKTSITYDSLLKTHGDLGILTKFSEELCSTIEKLSSQQRFMLQGWQVAAANLAEVASDSLKELTITITKLKEFELHVLAWEASLKECVHFDNDCIIFSS
ncbi:hypothetical protein Ciccas_011441 [Cichlidogyrus casuarinus]|uniref:Uncharacterized protein n=1 Tax=Cichlidogyrus casuarinus TaxID=1844966 RepID=A0ABD2PU65_9PLAT